jgi:hypothetical protein
MSNPIQQQLQEKYNDVSLKMNNAFSYYSKLSDKENKQLVIKFTGKQPEVSNTNNSTVLFIIYDGEKYEMEEKIFSLDTTQEKLSDFLGNNPNRFRNSFTTGDGQKIYIELMKIIQKNIETIDIATLYAKVNERRSPNRNYWTMFGRRKQKKCSDQALRTVCGEIDFLVKI